MSSTDVAGKFQRSLLAVMFIAVLTGAVAGCYQSEGAASGGTPTDKEMNPTGTQQYMLTGKVISVSDKSARIANDNIPGFMPAKTADYPVYNGADLDRMSPGEFISGIVVAMPSGFYLENVTVYHKRTGTAPPQTN